MEQFTGVFVALGFNALDIVTGLASAVKNKNVVSGKMRDGLFKKLAFILCYVMAWVVDTYGGYVGFNLTIKILPIIVLYVCATELVSILENIEKINPKLGISKLRRLFHVDDIPVDIEDKESEEENK